MNARQRRKARRKGWTPAGPTWMRWSRMGTQHSRAAAHKRWMERQQHPASSAAPYARERIQVARALLAVTTLLTADDEPSAAPALPELPR